MITTTPSIHRFAVPLISFALAISASACASTAKKDANVPTAAASASATGAQPVASTKGDTTTPTSGSVHIEDRIIKACGDIPRAHFAFDSATIGTEARAALDALARCFVTGPLKGRPMRLVGHADPRGEAEYNVALGQRRAGTVEDYLATKGLEKSREKALSKGAFEATGTDEQGWARDRKVDVFIDD